VRRAGSAGLLAALVLAAAAACGQAGENGQRALDRFFANTEQGRAWAKRFPHTPSSRPCTAVDHGERVPATCSTDVAVNPERRVVATFTVSWSHGSRARTWFVFLRSDGTVESIKREGVA
jgi:hypothetical protein